MPVVTFLPSGQQLPVPEQLPLRTAAKTAGLTVNDRCGGNGACGCCVVTIVAGAEACSPKTPVEQAHYLEANERLSCQCTVVGPVTVQLH